MNVLCLCDPVLVPEGCRGGFCEKLLAASLMSSRASASQLQGGPAAGQGKAQQQWWYCLWGNVFKRGENPSLEQSVPKGLHPMEGTHTEAVHEELQPREGLTLGKFALVCPRGRELVLEQVKSVRCPVPGEK